MKKYLPAIVFFVVAFASCRQSHLDEQINSINNSLSNSNKLIAANNSRNYEFSLKRLTQFWSPVSLDNWDTVLHVINGLSTIATQHIDSLALQLQAVGNNDEKANLLLLNREADNLHHRLQIYYQAVIQAPEPALSSVHPNIQVRMKREMEQVRKRINQQSWQAADLKDLALPQALAMLNKLKADVLITEADLLSYCANNIPYPGRPCELFGAIAILNSSYAKSGQRMQAFVGSGTFSVASKPYVMIGDRRVTLQEEGVAVYKFIVSGKPGINTVPVCIEYNKPDGTYNVINEKLEYIIAQ